MEMHRDAEQSIFQCRNETVCELDCLWSKCKDLVFELRLIEFGLVELRWVNVIPWLMPAAVCC